MDTNSRVDLKTVAMLKRKPGQTVHSVAGTQHYTFAMSCNQKPYDDVNVRLAMQCAIDRQEVLDTAALGEGTVIGPIAKPKYLLFTPDLPKTRSGKIMRRLLRDVAEGRSLGDTTTLADPSVVERLKQMYEEEGA